MNDTPQLDMHIYLRGAQVPVYLSGISAHTAEAIVEDLTSEPSPAMKFWPGDGWYVLEDGKRIHRLRRADVHRITTTELTAPAGDIPPLAGGVLVRGVGEYVADGSDPQIPRGTPVTRDGAVLQPFNGEFS